MAARPIIDGRTDGFCKLIVDRGTHQILGCHVVGERAVEIAQAGGDRHRRRDAVDQFVRIPLVVPHLHQHARSRSRDRLSPLERRRGASRADGNAVTGAGGYPLWGGANATLVAPAGGVNAKLLSGTSAFGCQLRSSMVNCGEPRMSYP